MTKILIVDDHDVVRSGLKQILEEEFESVVFGEAGNAREATSLLSKKKWDVMILDITMEGRSGLDVLKESKHLCPDLPVLVLSMHPEDQYALRVLKAGASGYLTKQSASEDLVKAIKKVMNKGKYISETLAEKLVVNLESGKGENLHEDLSDREYEIMLLIASGKTISEIAKKLSLSVKTISTYRARVLSKTGMKNNAEIMWYAVQNKLV